MISDKKFVELKSKLEFHYKNFDKSKISPDPLEFPHRFKHERDIEISAFISSAFAFGNIKQIMNVLEKIHAKIGSSPFDFVMNFSPSKEYFSNLKHRFYSSQDIDALFNSLRKIYSRNDNMEKFFIKSDSMKSNIQSFSKEMIDLCSINGKTSLGIKFMFPNPEKGSACKRMNLFLRWMIRKDELDFGLWKNISPSQLIIPVDVHIARISQKLKLTTRKNISWNMAEEITNNLKKIDPVDPVKYDFALCHIGIRKIKF